MFLRIKDRKSSINLDDVKCVKPFYNVNVHVVRFYFKSKGYFDWSFHKKSEVDKVIQEIEKLVEVKIIEI